MGGVHDGLTWLAFARSRVCFLRRCSLSFVWDCGDATVTIVVELQIACHVISTPWSRSLSWLQIQPPPLRNASRARYAGRQSHSCGHSHTCILSRSCTPQTYLGSTSGRKFVYKDGTITIYHLWQTTTIEVIATPDYRWYRARWYGLLNYPYHNLLTNGGKWLNGWRVTTFMDILIFIIKMGNKYGPHISY